LLYGDGVITPAISVLRAVEGLAIASSRLSPLVVPLTKFRRKTPGSSRGDMALLDQTSMM